jgi:CDP-glucose 4,6-dehydratase
MFGNAFNGRRVLVTGHTGFKGSWLCAWLNRLGAEVTGFSVDVPTTPSNFAAIGLDRHVRHIVGDVTDAGALASAFDEAQPDIVFHLAAQALVRRSYAEPARTFEVNTMGTLNVLECVRQRPNVRAAVLVTSDKCYRNVGWAWGYREDDRLGGEDPYSGSKGAAELVAYSYISSYFGNEDSARVATARAGNVIGGGDWAEDRIVPDCVRAWGEGRTVVLRQPDATRPWQHVLEPLSGYLVYAAHAHDSVSPVPTCNFGPGPGGDRTVETVVNALAQYNPERRRWVSSGGRCAPATTFGR